MASFVEVPIMRISFFGGFMLGPLFSEANSASSWQNNTEGGAARSDWKQKKKEGKRREN